MEAITKEHIQKALMEIDENSVPFNAHSSTYDVVVDGRRYPPKLVIEKASKYSPGESLSRKNFEGGLGTPAFQIFEKYGYTIKKKNDVNIKELLTLFLNDAERETLKTSYYPKRYKDYLMDVSFGQGTLAERPWIAIRDKSQQIQKGIYPVYLFYRTYNKLILTYGVSENNAPDYEWDLNNLQSVSEHLQENSKRTRCGFVHTVYDIKDFKLPNNINYEQDLIDILNDYKNIIKINSNATLTLKNKTLQTDFNWNNFLTVVEESGLILSDQLTQRFVASLQTKPFVILTGLSGSGKTKLAEAYSSWICEFDKQVCMVAVGADWTNRESLLGYPNALASGSYVKPDSKILDLILNAENDLENPYFLILDEMNMSHVERYFADFLSAMESVNSTISLHSGDKEWNGVPSQVTLPKNLFIIGTVNVDETTYMFSPKVLDRANVIEFRVSKDEMDDYLNSSINLDMKKLNGKGAHMAQDFVSIALGETGKVEGLGDKLMPFFDNLQTVGAEFGYRSASEISRFVGIYNSMTGIIEEHDAIDAAIAQKLLPKLHGSRNKLQRILVILAKQCLYDTSREDAFKDVSEDDIKYPISYEKLKRMHERIMADGFTSFAEA